MNIKFEDVMSVYSGKPGCCCGCRGKHTYRKDLQKEAGNDRGYPVNDEECNDQAVQRIINKLNKDENTKLEESTKGFSGHYFLETETRLYIAYLAPSKES